MPATSPLIDRLLAKISPEPNSGCWLWIGSLDQCGYGMINRGRRIGTAKAHRVAWEMFRGPIPANMELCHRCDVRCCVNPRHLFLGTHQENMKDRDRKGRTRVGRGDRHWQRLYPERRLFGDRNGTHTHPERVARGESHGRARLSERDVLAIRKVFVAGNVTKAELGRQYGIDEVHIGSIIRGNTWKHVGGPRSHDRKHDTSSKLTAELVRKLRRRFAEGETNLSALARESGVTPQAMRAVITRATWRHIEEAPL